MEKLYFGSSKNLSNERNKFLDSNKEIFLNTMRLTLLSDNRFSEDYRKNINRLYKKMQKQGISNSLYEKDIMKIINFFQKHLDINNEVNLTGNLLVDYMYELSREFHERYYTELFNATYGSEKEADIEQEKTFEKPKDLINGGLKYPRNLLLPNQVISLGNYMCEVDKDHKYFTSITTNKNYVEAHHLIPLAHQDEYNNSLDVTGNMVSLCVVCHKKLHHAPFEEKKEILISLYEKKGEVLKKHGININLNDFLKYYQGDVKED
jgi:hypothetical protein